MRAIGTWIGERLNRMNGPVRFLIPERGVSGIDVPGKPFHDPEADNALFEALEKTVQPGRQRQIIRVPAAINDPAFAAAAGQGLPQHRHAAEEDEHDGGAVSQSTNWGSRPNDQPGAAGRE